MSKLTKYEIVRILGVRATQISQGAEPFVDVGNLFDPIEIARKELNEGKLPFEIIRRMPDQEYVVIKLDNI